MSPFDGASTGMTAYRDMAVGVGLIGFAVGAILGVRHLEGWASLYPILMAVALIVGAVLLVGFSVAGGAEPVDTAGEAGKQEAGAGHGGTPGLRPGLRDVLPVMLASVVLVAAVPWLGFYPAVFLYLAGLFVWRSGLKAVPAILLGVALTVVIYLVFGLFLAVPTPAGLVGAALHG